MSVLGICAGLLLALPGAAGGTTASGALDAIPTPWRAGFARIREADLRADLGFVASDALLGRMSLEPGDDSAIEWIAAEFKKAGLEPPNICSPYPWSSTTRIPRQASSRSRAAAPPTCGARRM